MSNIDELKVLSARLSALLADPHPGLVTWHEAVHKTIDDIAAFHRDPEPEPARRWIVNGQTRFGWRIDDLAGGRVGLDLLSNPVALVPRHEDAELICRLAAAGARCADWLDAYAQEQRDRGRDDGGAQARRDGAVRAEVLVEAARQLRRAP